MLESLYTAAEMRAAEERYSGTVEELMERAGRAVAEHALEDFGNARSFCVVCGGGSNGGDGRVAARVLEEAGRDVRVVDAKPEDDEKDLGDPDVLIDALFGTGFEGAPRPGSARLIEQMNDLGAPDSPGVPPTTTTCPDVYLLPSGLRRGTSSRISLVTRACSVSAGSSPMSATSR
jgi:NAD(P)H-hydrate repair Nnr-like enzyme with NAD(P)H-hydrate epimerase domain